MQWGARRSYYVDESALLLSVFRRPLDELILTPLFLDQTAPPAFLALMRLAFLGLGPGELSMRLFPLIAGIASVPLMTVLARRLLPPLEAVLVTGLFAFSTVQIYYAADAKPYSLDVLCALIVLLQTDLIVRNTLSRWRTVYFSAGAYLLILVSQPVAILLACSALAILLFAWRNRRAKPSAPPVFIAASWLVAAAISVAFARSRMTREGLEYMQLFWQSGFFPVSPSTMREALWLPITLGRFTFDPLGSALPGPLLLPLAVGVVWFARRSLIALMLGALPIAAVLAASALGQYPFGASAHPLHGHNGRVVLFLVPSALLLVGGGVAWLRTVVFPRRSRAGILVAAFFFSLTVVRLFFVFPERREEIRTVLEQVQARRAPDDLLYVYYGAQFTFDVYAPMVGLGDAPVWYGSCSRAAPMEYLSELSTLAKYPRVWIIFGHPFRSEVSLFLRVLDRLGARRQVIEHPQAAAVLYDFTGSPENLRPVPDRLLRPPAPPWPDIGCRGVFRDLLVGPRDNALHPDRVREDFKALSPHTRTHQ